jgi:glucose-6-phosphate-specific signal transduction histidine kinase
VRVSVVNGPVPGHEPGTPVPQPREGHGLTGMRERVAAEGGTLWAGPTSDGGFTVWATLPVAAAPAAAAEEVEGPVR